MTLNELRERLLRHKPDLIGRGVSHLAVFGSRARGEARPDSDIDLMIEIARRPFTLLDLVGIEQDLSDDLGLPVQVVVGPGLRPAFAASIQRDRVDIF